jgi:hypothetical protein
MQELEGVTARSEQDLEMPWQPCACCQDCVSMSIALSQAPALVRTAVLMRIHMPACQRLCYLGAFASLWPVLALCTRFSSACGHSLAPTQTHLQH